MDREVRQWSTGDDPTDGALSPWVWMPIAFLSLCSILFISFRRVQSIALYERARAYTSARLPFTKPARGIRLSSNSRDSDRDLTGAGGLDSDSESSFIDDGDELPSSLPPPRPSLLERGRQGVSVTLDTLGWTGTSSFGGFGRAAAAADKDAGIGSAFWGIRKKDQTGRIRLGDPEAPPQRKKRPLAVPAGLLERVSDPPPVHSPTRSAPQSPKVSCSPSLFDVGEEEENDAVELPHEFRLPNGTSRYGARGAGSPLEV